MKFFNQEYSKYEPFHKTWKNSLFPAIVVLLIFLLFQPFGFRDKELKLKIFLIPGYVLLVFFYTASFFVFVRHILKTKKNWTIKNELVSQLIGLILFTLVIHLFTFWITDDMPLNLYWYFKLFYHCTSFFLVIAILEFLYYNYISADLQIDKLTSQIQHFHQQIDATKRKNGNETILIRLEKDTLKIKRNKIVYIQSAGNYLEFYLREINGQTKKLVKRGRLHQVEKDLKNCVELFRCHRAFIVNLKQVQGMKGNIKNARLVFDDNLDEIPVSRPHFKALKEQLEKIIAS